MGYTVTQIVEILGCNRQSVHHWFDTFEEQGCQGLYDKPRSGRPAIATVDYRTRLAEAIKTNPRRMGYPFTIWTLTQIRARRAREIQILLSESRVPQIMKEEGLVFKMASPLYNYRPTTDEGLADLQKMQEAIRGRLRY